MAKKVQKGLGRRGHKEQQTPTEELPVNPIPNQLGLHDWEQQNVFKIKVNKRKGPADFEGLRLIQELVDCRVAIWSMKWSICGQLLAVAGQDQLLRVYCSFKAWEIFHPDSCQSLWSTHLNLS